MQVAIRSIVASVLLLARARGGIGLRALFPGEPLTGYFAVAALLVTAGIVPVNLRD